MAVAKLVDLDRPGYELPALCLRCGAAATLTKRKMFSWHPSWVIILLLGGLLPYVLVAVILTKRMTVPAPLCQRHRFHWGGRQFLIWGTLVGLLGLVFLLAMLSQNMPQRIASTLWLGVALGFLGWLIFALIVHWGTIRPTEITDYTITLRGVAEGFEDAARQAHRAMRRPENLDVGDYWGDRQKRRRPSTRDHEVSDHIRPTQDNV